MAEYAANTVQTVNPGENVLFTIATVPCTRGLVRWRQGSGNFSLSGWVPNKSRCCGCNCNQTTSAVYNADFGANIAIPTGQTVGEISLALNIDGATVPSTQMIVTPAAVEQYFNVSRAIGVQVWRGCCETVSVRNTSNIPILVQNANIIFSRPDLAVTY